MDGNGDDVLPSEGQGGGAELSRFVPFGTQGAELNGGVGSTAAGPGSSSARRWEGPCDDFRAEETEENKNGAEKQALDFSASSFRAISRYLLYIGFSLRDLTW